MLWLLHDVSFSFQYGHNTQISIIINPSPSLKPMHHHQCGHLRRTPKDFGVRSLYEANGWLSSRICWCFPWTVVFPYVLPRYSRGLLRAPDSPTFGSGCCSGITTYKYTVSDPSTQETSRQVSVYWDCWHSSVLV